MVVALVALAGLAWVLTDERMTGMDEGPGTDPGSLGFYVSIWVVMMVAMMLPSAAPMVAVHSAVERRRRELGRHGTRGASVAFVVGYLLVWTTFGLVAYALFEAVRSFDVNALSWSRAGRYVAVAVIASAAVYQLTPLKEVCLSKCRSPLAFVVGSWRQGRLGAARMGAEHGAWCVGCCWALMATLFAVGLMSITWTIAIAAVVALEKLVAWRGANRGVAALLLVLAVAVALAPDHVPGLTIPG
jgi:predicted metal-binding membrane protein